MAGNSIQLAMVVLLMVIQVVSGGKPIALPVKARVKALVKAPVPPSLPPSVLTPPKGGAPPAPEAMAPTPSPVLEDLFPPCQGVLVVYETTFMKKIYPYLNDRPWIQPYRFQATATLLNEGYSSIENWEMGILYQHGKVRF
jgi:hypothetical protein